MIEYSQLLDFRRGAGEADEGVYKEYMTEVDAAGNNAENSRAKSILHILFSLHNMTQICTLFWC